MSPLQITRDTSCQGPDCDLELRLYAVGEVVVEDGTSRAGAGIVLVARDRFGREGIREASYGLYNSQVAVAHLQAIRLALASLRPTQRGGKTQLHVAHPRILALAAGQPDAETGDLTTEVRKWLGFYPKLELILTPVEHPAMGRALELAVHGAREQQHQLSPTVVKT